MNNSRSNSEKEIEVPKSTSSKSENSQEIQEEEIAEKNTKSSAE